MADVSQNISAQLFVKELPAANRADFTGCKQDFSSPLFTTCNNTIDSDNAVENAFQQQLNLSEYYKSPYVFDTLKNDYMSKTMESHFETEPVYMGPTMQNNEVSQATQNIPVGSRDFIQGGIKDSGIFKENFGASNSYTWVLIIAALAILFYFYKNN